MVVCGIDGCEKENGEPLLGRCFVEKEFE